MAACRVSLGLCRAPSRPCAPFPAPATPQHHSRPRPGLPAPRREGSGCLRVPTPGSQRQKQASPAGPLGSGSRGSARRSSWGPSEHGGPPRSATGAGGGGGEGGYGGVSYRKQRHYLHTHTRTPELFSRRPAGRVGASGAGGACLPLPIFPRWRKRGWMPGFDSIRQASGRSAP